MSISQVLLRLSKGAVLAAGLLLLGLAAACGRSSDSSSDFGSLVPHRASVVGSVAIGEALGVIELNLNQFLEMLLSGSAEGQDGLVEFLDIDDFRAGGLFGDVSRADIFGEITDVAEVDDMEDVEYFGALLHGSFDEAALIAKLESKTGTNLVQRAYKGSNVYSPEDDEDDFELSVLDSSIFVVGTGGAVNDIIDLKAGDADPASGALIDTFNDLDDGLFGFAVKVPQGIADEVDLDSVPGFGGLPISLDFISALEIVGLGGELNGGSLDLVVTMDFADEDSAESLGNFIGGIVTLASGFLTDPNTAGLLEGLRVDREGSLLTLEIGIPLADIPELFGDLITPTITETSGDRPPETPEKRVLQGVIGEAMPVLVNINHVPEGQRVEYQDAPPSSGQHWPTPARCGFYRESLPDERVVHNMEHGNVVVSYNFTNPAQTTELREALDDLFMFEEWGVARPYDRIPDGQVALTAWGRVHTMTGVNPEEINLFFKAFAGILGPERFTC